MKDEKFDELFDEAFERAVSSASPVDPKSRRASWQRVQQHRMQHTSRRRRKRMVRLTGAAAGLILLGSVVFSEPVRTGALTPIYQKLYTWSTGEIALTTGEKKPLQTEGALTSPPPEGVQEPISTSEISDSEEPVITDFVTTESQPATLEEVREKLPYTMPEFPRIPADLNLDKVYLSVPDDGSTPEGYTLLYRGEGNREAMLSVQLLEEEENGTYGFGPGELKEVILDNGLEAQYVGREHNSLVHTIRGRLDIMVSGSLTEEEFLQIAGHIVDGES